MARKRYLVAYDIREDGRLRTVHKTMKGYGDPLQYSVFLCDLDPSERIVMRAALREAMDERVDSVAIVDLGDAATRGMECFEFLGVTMGLPEGGPRSSEVAASGAVMSRSPGTARSGLTCGNAP